MGLSQQIGSSSLSKPGVCTSSTRPATPYEGQMIYETDTDKVLVWNGTAWYANWNTAWGLVGSATSTTSDTSITAEEVELTVTWTAVANRNYKLSWFEPDTGIAGAGGAAIILRFRSTNLVGTQLQLAWSWIISSSVDTFSQCVYYGTFSAGSTTVVATAQQSGGVTFQLNRGTGKAAFFVVEDIGPV